MKIRVKALSSENRNSSPGNAKVKDRDKAKAKVMSHVVIQELNSRTKVRVERGNKRRR